MASEERVLSPQKEVSKERSVMSDKQQDDMESLRLEVKTLADKVATLKPVVISFESKSAEPASPGVMEADFERYQAETEKRFEELERQIAALSSPQSGSEVIPKNEAGPIQKPPVPALAPTAAPKNRLSIIRRSFSEKMLTASNETLGNYNALRNYLSSYRDVVSRISFPCESYRAHRKLYAKIVCCQKTLKLYLALNPKAYLHSTIPIEDVSKRKDYQEVPCLLRVQSALSLRRAEKLIAEMLKQAGVTQKKEGVGNLDYAHQVRSQGQIDAEVREKKMRNKTQIVPKRTELKD
jgi:hypothetical protein